MPRTTSCINSLINAFKWLPVLVTTAIFFWGWYAFVFQLVLYSLESTYQQIAYFVIFHTLYLLSLWSYAQTVFTRPGRIPQQFYLTPEVAEELAIASKDQERDEILANYVKRNNLPISCRTYSGGIRICEKCNLIKPDRCHHCSVSNRCILRFDHFCPWTNNAISYTNYKFFVLFLGYTFTLCVFVGATTFPYTLSFWNFAEQATTYKPSNSTGVNGASTTSNPGQIIPFNVRFQILFLFFVTSMLSIGIVFLFGYHVYLLLRNQTTLESFRAPLMTYGPDKRAFDLGTRENFLQLFGRKKLLWLLPIFTTEGTGYTYDQRPIIGPGDEEVRQELLSHNRNNHNRQNSGNTDTEV